MNWKYIFILLSLFAQGCSPQDYKSDIDNSAQLDFKQNYSVSVPEIEGADDYDNIKEYDIIIETRYQSIDYYENIVPPGKGDSIIDVIVFADTNTYISVIEEIYERLPYGVEQIDFAVWNNGKPSIVKLDFHKIDNPGVGGFKNYNLHFEVLFNKEKRLLIESEHECKTIDSLEYYYVNFYNGSDELENAISHRFNKTKDLELALFNAKADYEIFHDKSSIEKFEILLGIKQSIFPLYDFSRNSNAITGGFHNNTEISFLLKLVVKFREIERKRLCLLYPNLSPINIILLEKLTSPKIYFNLWYGNYRNPIHNLTPPPPPITN
jgi:hypothetical protein